MNPDLHLVRLMCRPIVFFLVALMLSIPAEAQKSRLAIHGATVITVAGDEPISDALILVDDGRISWVGPVAERPDLKGYDLLDANGKWVIPGLIDTNVHLILNVIPEFYVKYEDQLEDIAIQSAQVGLKYGMTTMADTWGPLEPLLAARNRIRSGEVVGSDVLVAGNIIGTGGPFSPYFMQGWDLRGKSLRYGGWVAPIVQQRINALWEAGMGPDLMAATPEEAAERMRSYIARGVDFVKLGISGHGIEPVEPLMFTDEVLDAMVAEIRAASIPFQTHTFTIASLEQAIRLEPDMLQHPNVMSPGWGGATAAQKAAVRESISQMESGGMLAGLMAVPERRQMDVYQNWTSDQTDDPYLDEIMQYRKPWFAGVSYEQMAEGVRVWLDSGVEYTLATDQGPETSDLGPTVWGRMGRAHFDRLIGLQDAGEQPMDILRAATLNGARAYQLEDEIGTIEPGKWADLVVLDANPLVDIANLRSISTVIKHGMVVDRAALPTHPVLDYDPELPWPY